MPRPLHPLHAIFLAGALSLFVGALLADIAYASSYQVQWKNFASWLLIGALSVGSAALAWTIADFVRLADDRAARRKSFLVVLVAMWLLGVVDALVHAGDAWASMPEGLVLSAIVALLAVAAVWLGFADYRTRVVA